MGAAKFVGQSSVLIKILARRRLVCGDDCVLVEIWARRRLVTETMDGDWGRGKNGKPILVRGTDLHMIYVHEVYIPSVPDIWKRSGGSIGRRKVVGGP